MTDKHSPIDTALDLLVFAPLGFALSATEEIPKLAAKGRAQVEGQLSMARVLGQFAISQGRKQVEQRFGGGDQRGAAPKAPAPPVSATAAFEETPGDDGAGDRSGGTETATGARLTVVTAAEAEGPGLAAVEEPAPAADGLAIPGYDSLSASQVVQRLAGLSAPELAAVGAYESAHRSRRTVLTRISQLQGS